MNDTADTANTADTNVTETSMKIVRAVGLVDGAVGVAGEAYRAEKAVAANVHASESLFVNWSSSQMQEFDRLVYELTQAKRRSTDNRLLTG